MASTQLSGAIACQKSNVANAANLIICWMRSSGTPAELEHRRLLAIRRLLEGFSAQEVAEFLEVDARSVQRWWQLFRQGGWLGLAAKPISGRPRKLDPTQEKIVLRWLESLLSEFGFATDLWTTRRLVQLIREEWGIALSAGYMSEWLRARGFTPQKPQRVPRERDPQAIAAWLTDQWPRIKKKHWIGTPTSF